MVWPARRGLPNPPDATPVLMSDTSGCGLSVGVVVEDGGEPVGRVVPGGTPLAVAMFVTDPAASSAAVTVYTLSAVQVSESPVARVGSGHVIVPMVGSETLMLDSGRTPVLVTVNVKAIVSPASVRPLLFTSVGVPASFCSATPTGSDVFVIVQSTKSPMPNVIVAEDPMSPEGSSGSETPFRVHDHAPV